MLGVPASPRLRPHRLHPLIYQQSRPNLAWSLPEILPYNQHTDHTVRSSRFLRKREHPAPLRTSLASRRARTLINATGTGLFAPRWEPLSHASASVALSRRPIHSESEAPHSITTVRWEQRR